MSDFNTYSVWTSPDIGQYGLREDVMGVLVGATLTDDARRSGGVLLPTDRGVWDLVPSAGCCSACYIQHIGGAEALAAGAVILEIEDIGDVGLRGLPETGHDEQAAWGTKIKTTKGWATIELRLEHNGCYSGEIIVQHPNAPWGALPVLGDE